MGFEANLQINIPAPENAKAPAAADRVIELGPKAAPTAQNKKRHNGSTPKGGANYKLYDARKTEPRRPKYLQEQARPSGTPAQTQKGESEKQQQQQAPTQGGPRGAEDRRSRRPGPEKPEPRERRPQERDPQHGGAQPPKPPGQQPRRRPRGARRQGTSKGEQNQYLRREQRAQGETHGLAGLV
ncbi:hypothetical protein GB937_005502 [Aspergillus fischeri]|nr:hypothetical protein GB937_005502 [Aspergillus fischeri]